jgi:hypothetical protein
MHAWSFGKPNPNKADERVGVENDGSFGVWMFIFRLVVSHYDSFWMNPAFGMDERDLLWLPVSKGVQVCF